MRAASRPAPPAIDDDAIAALMDAFYGRVRQDAMLAPVFVQAIGSAEADWVDHLATLRAFWSSVMLTSGRYSGNPLIAHARLPDLEPAMFDRWLAIFEQTCTDTLEPDVAAAFVEKANRIAHSLRRGVFGPPTQEDV